MPVSLEELRALAPTLSQMEADAEPEEANRILRFSDVQPGPEFMRILGVERREAPDPQAPSSLELARFLTSRLARSAEPYPGPMSALQALALQEAWLQGQKGKGFVFMGRTGAGKTLVSALLPEIVRAPRPLLVTQAKMLTAKPGHPAPAKEEFNKMRMHWAMRPAHQYPMISYELLANPSSGELFDEQGQMLRQSRLERMAPSDIIFDECHALKDSGTTVAKRVKAYKKAHPQVRFWFMTGTMFTDSIKDACHLFEWALGEDSPLPNDWEEREMWANYLDAKRVNGPRVGVGALLDLLDAEEQSEYELEGGDYEAQRARVRRGVAKRILETPGVLGTKEPPIPVGLEVHAIQPEDECLEIEEAMRKLRGDPNDLDNYPGWQLPDGTELADAMQFSRHAKTIALGFWQKWDPAPNDAWKFHRNEWSKWCRKAIRYNRRGIDSEALMKDAVRKGLVSDVYEDWEFPQGHPSRALVGESRLALWEGADAAYREETGLREPPSVCQWLSDEIVDICRAWLEEVGCGLIWVDSIGLGERLEKELRIPYYRAGGQTLKGRLITRHPGGSAVASVKANGTGKNLQAFWSNALWLTPPGEQSLARLHRQGQKADCVRNWYFLGCQEHLRAFYAARNNKAAFAEQMQESAQKLMYAETNMPTERELRARGGRRWATPPKKNGAEEE